MNETANDTELESVLVAQPPTNLFNGDGSPAGSGTSSTTSPPSTPTTAASTSIAATALSTAFNPSEEASSAAAAQMLAPLDISAMFGKFFANNNISKIEPNGEAKEVEENGGQQEAMTDQKVFMQLSHLFSAAPNQQRASTTSPAVPNNNSRPSKVHETSLGQDRKRSYPYTFQYCVLCQKNVHSSKLPCHIRQCHVGKPMFQCPACDFTSTYSKNNVKSHMVSLHGLAGDPISFMDQYAGQVEEFMKKCFPNVRGRGRPVHGRMSPGSCQGGGPMPKSPLVNNNGRLSPYEPSKSPPSTQNPTPPPAIHSIKQNGNHEKAEANHHHSRSYQRHNGSHQKTGANGPPMLNSCPTTTNTNPVNRFNEICANILYANTIIYVNTMLLQEFFSTNF